MFDVNGQRVTANSTRRFPASEIQDTWSPGSSTTACGIRPTNTGRSAIAPHAHQYFVQFTGSANLRNDNTLAFVPAASLVPLVAEPGAMLSDRSNGYVRIAPVPSCS